MSEPQALYTTTAEQIAAELDALSDICDTIANDPDDMFFGAVWNLHLGSVPICIIRENIGEDDQALIVGWVMAECEREGWSMMMGNALFDETGGRVPAPWEVELFANGAFTTAHESLALSALKAYRAAREAQAEVRHG